MIKRYTGKEENDSVEYSFNPKPIIGYSDISAYHSAWIKCGVAAVHSPMAATFTSIDKDCVDVEKRSLKVKSRYINAREANMI